MRIFVWIFTTTLLDLMVVIEYMASINYSLMHSVRHPTVFWCDLGSTFEGKNRKSVMKNAAKDKELDQTVSLYIKDR